MLEAVLLSTVLHCVMLDTVLSITIALCYLRHCAVMLEAVLLSTVLHCVMLDTVLQCALCSYGITLLHCEVILDTVL